MWELYLKWLLTFGWILGGTLLFSGSITGIYCSFNKVFGYRNEFLFGDPHPQNEEFFMRERGIISRFLSVMGERGIISRFLSAGAVFSISGGLFWLVLVRYRMASEVDINYTISLSGILGSLNMLLYMVVDWLEDDYARISSVVGVIVGVIGGYIVGEIGGTTVGVIVGGIVGSLIGEVVGEIIEYGVDDDLKDILFLLFIPYVIISGITTVIFGVIAGISADGISGILSGVIFGLSFVLFVALILLSVLMSEEELNDPRLSEEENYLYVISTRGIAIIFGMVAVISIGGISGIFRGMMVGLSLVLIVIASIFIFMTTIYIEKMIYKIISFIITLPLILLRYKTILCNNCLRYTNPLKSRHKIGTRYCEHCHKEVERTKDIGKVIFTFGTSKELPEDYRIFTFSNPDFEQKDEPIDVSEVYIDTKTCDKYLIQRFIMYIGNYPPKKGLHSVQIFHKGELDALGLNLANALRNNFKKIEEWG